MTFVRREPVIMVGEIAMPRIGSTVARSSGGRLRTVRSSSRGAGTRPRAEKSASVSGIRRGGWRISATRWMSRAARTSALSAIPGMEAWPLRPCTRSLKGALIFSAVEHR